MLRAALAALLAMTAAAHAEQVETPDYRVAASAPAEGVEGTVEARLYAPMIVAETIVSAASRDEASSKGFMPLAGYIFGRNGPDAAATTSAPADGGIPKGPGERIAMTAPVTTAPAMSETEPKEEYRVRFMMPARYTIDTLPEPADPDVKLLQVPERAIVALGFTGARTQARVDATAAAVDRFVEAKGLEADGPYAVAGYDGPDVPESERRWEVQQPVRSLEPLR